MTMSLSKIASIPTSEVAWIANRSVALNSTWTILLLVWLVSLPVLVLIQRLRARPAAAPAAPV